MQSVDIDEHQTTCYGAQLPDSQKFKFQEKDCNLIGCPGNSMWLMWSRWGQCSYSCGEGTKERRRKCAPAKNGGKECPDIVKQNNLYYERAPCTEEDCEIFRWATWSSWSSCSATCGKGVKKRQRGCISATTLQNYPVMRCGNDKTFFLQDNHCINAACPINGGWSAWTEFEACTQNCLHHPDGLDVNKKEKVKAVRIKRRYCTNPIPQHRGKKCVKDKRNKYDSNHKSEYFERPCTEEDNIPWCPENCIFTEWGAWGLCSVTCVPVTVRWKHWRDRTAKPDLNEFPDGPFPPTGSWPSVRSRHRVLIKEARFNGVCEKSPQFVEDKTKKTLGYEHAEEECVCCEEHLKGNPYKVGALQYDPKKGCVPYCPLDCEWGAFKIKDDCCELTYKEKQTGWNKEKKCLDLAVVKNIKTETKFKKYREILVTGIRNNKPMGNNQELIQLVKSVNSYVSAYNMDVAMYQKLQIKSIERSVKGPLIDPMYGGNYCFTRDNLTMLTRFTDLADKPNSNYTLQWDELLQEDGVCDVPICVPKPVTTKPGYRPPCFFFWTDWSPWGKCNLQCGDKGFRQRTRKCTPCAQDKRHEPNPPKHQCDPEKTFDGTPGVKDIDKSKCSPCPSEHFKGWSDWGPWSAPDVTCGTTKLTRTRKCNDDYMKALEKEENKKCLGKGGIEKDHKEARLQQCRSGPMPK